MEPSQSIIQLFTGGERTVGELAAPFDMSSSAAAKHHKKRGEWLASGPLAPKVGGKVELRFKHSDLSPNKTTPEHYKRMDITGHRAKETITEIDAPHHLAFT
jgi:hypothetical protein